MDHAYNTTYLTTYTYGNEDKGNIMGWYSKDSPWQQIDGMPDTYLVFKGMKSKHLIKSKTNYNSAGSIDNINSQNIIFVVKILKLWFEHIMINKSGVNKKYPFSTICSTDKICNWRIS